MSVLRLFHKLRKMSPHEIRTRIAEKIRAKRERSWYQKGLIKNSVPTANLKANSLRLVPGATATQLRQLQEDYPQETQRLKESAIERAERILAGQWQFLGYPIDVSETINWHADPRTDYVFPQIFYADMSLYNLSGGVDVKYVWELGRHQFLVELARGWRFSGEERYAERARELTLDWIAENRLYEGVHWTSALEFSMRAISWIWTIATLNDWSGWQAEDMTVITASLRDHAAQIEHHLSYYSSPYNHLVGEAAGLYLIGCVLEGTDDAERWRRLGRRVLQEHGPRQFYADGFCVEQATGYHYYTLGFMALAIAAARNHDEPLEELEASVHRAFQAGLAFRQPGGRWPAIGDVDSARSIPVHHDDFWSFDSLSLLGAAMFQDSGLIPAEERFSEEAYWLLGTEAVTYLKQQKSTVKTTAHVLPDAGYATASSAHDWICLDGGPLGDGLHADATPSTAHGHADALQLLYHHGGRDILIDPGMPFYFGEDDWVGQFRSPAAHNTIEIDGVEMARRAGRLAWSHVAPRPTLDVKFTDEVWLARGSAEWAPGTKVERNILAIPERGVWIADCMTSDRPRATHWYWQLPDEEAVDPRIWTNADGCETEIVSAEEGNPTGWFAPGYGVHHRGKWVHVELPSAEKVMLVSFFGDHPAPVEVETGGERICCSTDETTGGLSLKDDVDASASCDIIWRVELDGELQIYTAGATDGAGTALEGTGAWPVMKQIQSLSSVS